MAFLTLSQPDSLYRLSLWIVWSRDWRRLSDAACPVDTL